MKETGEQPAFDDEGDGLQRALPRLPPPAASRGSVWPTAAPARLPNRIGAVARAEREEALLLDEARVDPRLVRGGTAAKTAACAGGLSAVSVLRRANSRSVSCQSPRTRTHGGARAARAGLEGVGRSRGAGAPSARCPSCTNGVEAATDARAQSSLSGTARSARRRSPGRPAVRPTFSAARKTATAGVTIGHSNLQPRGSLVQIQPRDVGAISGWADVGRLGQQRRVADEARLEPIPGVAGAGSIT